MLTGRISIVFRPYRVHTGWWVLEIVDDEGSQRYARPSFDECAQLARAYIDAQLKRLAGE